LVAEIAAAVAIVWSVLDVVERMAIEYRDPDASLIAVCSGDESVTDTDAVRDVNVPEVTEIDEV
jgi:hypothetical protein